MRTAAQATAESRTADEGDGPEDMIVEVEEGAAKVLRGEAGEAGEAAEAAEAAEAGTTSDRSDLLGMCLEEGGALVLLRARSLQVFARGPGGGARPAAGGGGTAATATPEAAAWPHVDIKAHRGSASMAPSRPQQRQGLPGAAPRCGQPRQSARLGRAGRPHQPCFRHTQARSAALQKALAALEADEDW